MAVTSYTQWRFPTIPTEDGHAIGIRINRIKSGATWPSPTYPGQVTASTIFTLDSQFVGLISSYGDTEITKHDPDGELCMPKKDFEITDTGIISGKDGTGATHSYDLWSNQSSLNQEIFQDPDSVYELWLTDYSGPIGSPTIEVFFGGVIDFYSIQWLHVNIYKEFTNKARRLTHAKFTANSMILNLKQKPSTTGVPDPRTVQDLVDYIVTNSKYDEILPAYVGTGGLFFNNALPKDSEVDARYSQSLFYALNYKWTHSSTFPRATAFCKITSLFDWIRIVAGFQASSIDTNMMFDHYAQQAANLLVPDGAYWPLYTVDTLIGHTATWDDLYVFENFLLGMPITDNPPTPGAGYASLFVQWGCSIQRDATLDKLVGWICLQTGCYADYSIDTSGNFTIQLKARRTQGNTIPTAWKLLNGQTEEPTEVGKSSLIVQMYGDKLQLLAGTNKNDAVTLSIPWRSHCWGSPLYNAGAGSGNNLGIKPDENPFPLVYDKTIAINNQPFAVTTDKKSNWEYGSGSQDPTDIGWLGGSMLFYKLSVGNIYPSGVLNPNTLGNSMFAVAAILPAGLTLPTDELLNIPNGVGSYWIPGTAHAQFYYQEIVGNKVVLKQRFFGVRGNDGKLQSVKPDMVMSTYIRGAYRTFISHALKINEVSCIIEVTWVEVLSYLSILPSVISIQEDGSQSATNSSSSSGSGTGTPTFIVSEVNAGSLGSNTNNWAITFTNWTFIRVSSSADIDITGLAGGIKGLIVTIENVGSNYIRLTSNDTGSTAANRFQFTSDDPKTIGPNSSISLRYDSTLSRWVAISIPT